MFDFVSAPCVLGACKLAGPVQEIMARDRGLRVKPELVVSGHLHENARKEDEIGRIEIVKCWAFW